MKLPKSLFAYMTSFHAFTGTNYKFCGNCDNVILENDIYKCKLFGKINLINGKIYYDYCSEVRHNSSKCTEDGLYYTHYIPFAKS